MTDLAPLLEKIAVPVTVAIIGGIVTFLVARLGKKGDRENAHIDQLQEDRDKDRARIGSLEREVRVIEGVLRQLLTRDARWDIHATRVEAQVVALGGEPVVRPEELRAAVDLSTVGGGS